jgi:hypothetical protein
MLRWLSALSARLFGHTPTPPIVDEQSTELRQAAEETALAQRRMDFWIAAQKSGITHCIGVSAWARDTLERRERQPWPTRMPGYFREWLQGLTAGQLDIVGRTEASRLYNHCTFPYVEGCLIAGLPKREPLPLCDLEFPKSTTPLVDFAERRSGGGQKARPAGGRDLREIEGYASRGMR